jgi:hypothetical protein
MKIDGVSAVLVILIASFAIDRAVTAALFVVHSFARGRSLIPESDERRMKWTRFVLSVLLAGAVLAWRGNVHILAAVGFPGVNEYVDILVTTVILVGGSDRVTDILKMTGMPHPEKDAARQPIEITGKLVLEDSSAKFVAR